MVYCSCISVGLACVEGKTMLACVHARVTKIIQFVRLHATKIMKFVFLCLQKEAKAAKQKAVAEINRENLSDEQFETQKKKAWAGVEKQMASKAYKYLQIANPAHGDGFFRIVWDYD